ncbi:hypothetical protein [Halarchaeum sp. P4]|uniref:hypothetical protein n=1 Tax=Halarchaeum sp. P4 TaxID=3421639 RepID=UPI003EC01F24
MRKPAMKRRTFLRGIGSTLTISALGAASATASDTRFDVVESETSNTLHDVAATSGGLYAVGTSGVVLTRTEGLWKKVLDGGPSGNGNSLYGADVTDDGERLWFVGGSGAIGEYDVSTGTLYNHSAPNDVTNNFNDVAVTGTAGEANVYVAGDSGHIYASFENGEAGSWDGTTPGSGSAITAIDFHGPKSGHAVDGNQTVFSTADGGSWDKIGIENANYNFYAVDSDASDDVEVAGGGGSVYEWDGATWVRSDTGDASLRDVDVTGQTGYSVGGGGTVFEQTDGAWSQVATPTGQNLKGVVETDGLVVAVGAGGTVLEA